MSLALSNLTHDPVLRELAASRRRAEEWEKIAAERRSGVSGVGRIAEAAAEDSARWAARKPSTPPADDVVVDMSDVLSPELLGESQWADEHRRRLDAAIQGRMAAVYRGDKQRSADRDRVRAELGQPAYKPPPREAPKPQLTGEALIRDQAERDLPRLLSGNKRTRRR